jgi:hypothetical protein
VRFGLSGPVERRIPRVLFFILIHRIKYYTSMHYIKKFISLTRFLNVSILAQIKSTKNKDDSVVQNEGKQAR